VITTIGNCTAQGLDVYSKALTGDVSKTLNSAATDADHVPCVVLTFFENHPAGMSGNYQPVICLQGNCIDRSDTAGCNGKGWTEDVCYTLNTIDRPEVSYVMQGFGDYKESDKASGLKARDYKDATDLQAKPNGGQSLNFSGAVRIRYIVRRLTPTECARLQGFPDEYGHPDIKTELTDEEYAFWLGVRNTHAEINGKPQKTYTREQMLKWYNNLHTDSAEYKMWGNGIALPCAVFVMQGIAEELKKQNQNLKG
jgi:DNA (cytosine-5)-methyltransferase 1